MAVGMGIKAGLNAFSLAAACLLAVATAQAAPAEKMLRSAGPVPTDAMVNAAITRYFQGKGRVLNRRKPFRILSGPTLATGNTFAGDIEQAWLMCLVVNAEKTSPGPQDIEGKALYLRRSAAGAVSVVSTENWKDSSPQCDR